ncbi:MAG: hypothetical protein AAF723_05710, partial [Pseudomonadota bacterium]
RKSAPPPAQKAFKKTRKTAQQSKEDPQGTTPLKRRSPTPKGKRGTGKPGLNVNRSSFKRVKRTKPSAPKS